MGPLHSNRTVTRRTIFLAFIIMYKLVASYKCYKTRRKEILGRRKERKTDLSLQRVGSWESFIMMKMLF